MAFAIRWSERFRIAPIVWQVDSSVPNQILTVETLMQFWRNVPVIR